MDNHLWEHEDIVGAKLIVCVWKCMQARCVKGSGCRAVKLGYTKGLYFVAWWCITITACYCCKVYSGLFYLCTSFCPYHRSFVLWHVVCIVSLKSRATRVRMQAHTRKCFSLRADEFFHPTPLKWSPSQSGLASAFQLTLFPLQMTASTWEMSGSHCQHCVASSNICEVLSSSLQLSVAVSQEAGLLTRNTAKTAHQNALKHIHSACSFASMKDCISPRFMVFTAAHSPYCKNPCIT